MTLAKTRRVNAALACAFSTPAPLNSAVVVGAIFPGVHFYRGQPIALSYEARRVIRTSPSASVLARSRLPFHSLLQPQHLLPASLICVVNFASLVGNIFARHDLTNFSRWHPMRRIDSLLRVQYSSSDGAGTASEFSVGGECGHLPYAPRRTRFGPTHGPATGCA